MYVFYVCIAGTAKSFRFKSVVKWSEKNAKYFIFSSMYARNVHQFEFCSKYALHEQQQQKKTERRNDLGIVAKAYNNIVNVVYVQSSSNFEIGMGPFDFALHVYFLLWYVYDIRREGNDNEIKSGVV